MWVDLPPQKNLWARYSISPNFLGGIMESTTTPHVNIETGEVKRMVRPSAMRVWVPVRNMGDGDWIDLVTYLHKQIEKKPKPA